MDILDNLLHGFAAILDPVTLGALLFGVFVGSMVGALPGIGPVGAMAVLLPFSFTLDPTAGLLMIAGIYMGTMYGGSTTSILMKVPGEASSVVTAIDGYEMARRGRAGAALALAAIGSFVAGTLSLVLLMFAARPLSDLALDLGPPEYLALTVFALFVLSRLSGAPFAKTMLAAGLGLALATVGLDQSSGNSRFTFGNQDLLLGVEITAVAVGVFGIAELLLLVERRGSLPRPPRISFRDLYPNRRELREGGPAMVRGGLLGFVFGLMPGPSAPLSTYASYSLERRLSKHPEQFGHGAVAGVAGPESANNGASGGALVPLLTLGIPFAAPTALLLAGFTIHGAVPGPLFISEEPELFWGLVAGLYAANVALLVLNLPLVGIFTTVLRLPQDLLMTLILVVAVIGTLVTRNAMVDVVWLVALGVLGYAMAKVDLPRVALVLAFVIAPMMERSFNQTVALADGSPGYLLLRPVALTILVLTGLILATPLALRLRRCRGDAATREEAMSP